MIRTRLLATSAVLAFATALPASAQELRIGYLTTLSGSGAALGQPLTNGWKLGLEHEGWTKDGDHLGGVPTKVFYEDDQQKPDVALNVIERLIKSDKVHIIAGFAWSNVLNATRDPIVAAKIPLLVTNAGSAAIAGERCSIFFTSTSQNNDQGAEALGKLLADEKIESISVMVPNYQAGKDMIAGLDRTLKGPKLIDQILFKLGQTDYQAEISKIRAAKPKALIVFAPGAMGISFVKQWAASGAGKDIKLYTLYTVDYESLPAIGNAAVGTYHTNWWDPESDNPVNQKFVKDYVAKYGRMPSHWVAQGYDAARLTAAAVKSLNGKVDDGLAFAKALRKTEFPSVRGAYKYNVNGVPIQTFYQREVVAAPDGKLKIVVRSKVFENYKDAYGEKCPAAERS